LFRSPKIYSRKLSGSNLFRSTFLTGKVFTGISKDTLKTYSFDDIWESSSEYAKFLFDRLLQCKFLLKDTGSILFTVIEIVHM